MTAEHGWAIEVCTALDRLPVPSAAVLRASYFAGMSEAEIVTASGMSVQSVRHAAAEGLSQLGRMLLRGDEAPA